MYGYLDYEFGDGRDPGSCWDYNGSFDAGCGGDWLVIGLRMMVLDAWDERVFVGNQISAWGKLLWDLDVDMECSWLVLDEPSHHLRIQRWVLDVSHEVNKVRDRNHSPFLSNLNLLGFSIPKPLQVTIWIRNLIPQPHNLTSISQISQNEQQFSHTLIIRNYLSKFHSKQERNHETTH